MSDLDRAYDPDPLPIGTRVRVRLGGECPWPHIASEDGAVGTVVEAPRHGFTPLPGHTVWVEVVFNPHVVATWPFARAELERP